jgi:hypothetical protein
MPSIYNVTIDETGKENHFQVTWQNPKNNSTESFTREAAFSQEEIQRLWLMSKFQLPIGQKLFHFLDSENHYFQQALDRANLAGEVLQIHLDTCEKTHDWPFELLADRTFLLPSRLHLVRNVSPRGKGKKIVPQNRPLRNRWCQVNYIRG